MTAENDRFGLDDVRALAQVMKDFELGELELCRASGEKLHLSRATPPQAQLFTGAPLLHAGLPAGATHASPAAASHASGSSAAATGGATGQAASGQNLHTVSAPLVGTFYRSAGPDSPPFIDVGQRVRKGQTLCIIEAMKLMNELESEVDGIVAACLADNGRPVEYGQPLFHIERSSDRQK
jgi:acetyl-CoA carboxylase biotin carboxyl carrier protein